MGNTLNYYAEGFVTLRKIKQVLRDISKAFIVTEKFSPKTLNLGGATLRDTPAAPDVHLKRPCNFRVACVH
jgi:hypothetical protein